MSVPGRGREKDIAPHVSNHLKYFPHTLKIIPPLKRNNHVDGPTSQPFYPELKYSIVPVDECKHWVDKCYTATLWTMNANTSAI